MLGFEVVGSAVAQFVAGLNPLAQKHVPSPLTPLLHIPLLLQLLHVRLQADPAKLLTQSTQFFSGSNPDPLHEEQPEAIL